jgi:hypothetical protein
MFSKISSRSVNAVQAFHNDEAGQGTVEMLMIVGAAAVVMLAIVGLTNNDVMPKLTENVYKILGIQAKGGAAAPANP